MVWCMGRFVTAAVTLAFGCFLLSLTLIKDIEGSLGSINYSVKSKENSRADILKQLTESFEFHAVGKQLNK